MTERRSNWSRPPTSSSRAVDRRCSNAIDLARRFPGLVVCVDHALRPHRSLSPIGRPPSSSCRPSRAASSGGAGPTRSRSRRAGASASGSAARSPRLPSTRGRVARARAPATASTSTSRSAETMTIAGGNYAEYMGTSSLGSPPIIERAAARSRRRRSNRRSTATSGFCTNTRQQFDDFLLLIERPDLLGDDELARAPGRQKRWDEWNEIVHEWTPQHTTAEIVAPRAELRIPVAPVHAASEHPRAASTSSPAASSSTTRPARSRCRRRPWRMDDEDPPPPRPAPRLGEHTGQHRAPHAGAARATPSAPRAAARRRARARPHRVVGRSHRGGDDRRARRRRDPRRVDVTARRHAHDRRDARHGRSVVGAQQPLPLRRTPTSAGSRSISTTPRRPRAAATPDRRVRRGHRELHPARPRQLRARVGDDPGDQPALHPRAHAGVRLVGSVARQHRLRADDGAGHGPGVDHRPSARPAAHPAGSRAIRTRACTRRSP